MTEKEQARTAADGEEAQEGVSGYLLPILVPPAPPYGTVFPSPLPYGGGSTMPEGYWPGRDPRTADPIVRLPERFAE